MADSWKQVALDMLSELNCETPRMPQGVFGEFNAHVSQFESRIDALLKKDDVALYGRSDKSEFSAKYYATDWSRRHACEMYYNGATIADIARTFNTSYQSASRWIKQPLESTLYEYEYGPTILEYANENGWKRGVAERAANCLRRIGFKPGSHNANQLADVRNIGKDTLQLIKGCFGMEEDA